MIEITNFGLETILCIICIGGISIKYFCKSDTHTVIDTTPRDKPPAYIDIQPLNINIDEPPLYTNV